MNMDGPLPWLDLLTIDSVMEDIGIYCIVSHTYCPVSITASAISVCLPLYQW